MPDSKALLFRLLSRIGRRVENGALFPHTSPYTPSSVHSLFIHLLHTRHTHTHTQPLTHTHAHKLTFAMNTHARFESSPSPFIEQDWTACRKWSPLSPYLTLHPIFCSFSVHSLVTHKTHTYSLTRTRTYTHHAG